MSESFLARLAAGRLLLDGGLGTTLASRAGVAPQRVGLLNLEAPELVRRVHLDFLAAGSEVLQTNTFAANRSALGRLGVAQHIGAVLGEGVRLARTCVEEAGRGFVVGNLGPIGAFAGEGERPSMAELGEQYRELARLFLEAGVEAFSLETFADLAEARTAIAALREVSELPICACVTFERHREGWRIPGGEALTQALRALEAAGADAVGVNCGLGSGALVEAVPTFVGAVAVPLIAKPNVGPPGGTRDAPTFEQEPEAFAADLLRLAQLGAAAVGGCCGADPRFIAALGARL